MALIFAWLASALICVWVFYTPSEEAQKQYRFLMGQFGEAKGKNQVEARPIQQIRDQVSKQIFYHKDGHRLQCRLTSEHSDLIFQSKENGGELVECFKGIHCLMQEKLIEEPNNLLKQSLRFLKAKEAFYFYKSGQLEADGVNIAHYLAPGLTWPSSLDSLTPSFQGEAENIQFSLFNKESALKAHKLQAIFHGWESK